MKGEVNVEREIELLKKDLTSLRSLLVGLDGKDGLKRQMSELDREIKNLKISNKEVLELMTEIRIHQKNFPYVYSTKDENNQLKMEILDRLDKMEQIRREELERHKKEDKSDNRFRETLKHTKWSLYIAFIGLAISIVFNILSTRGTI